MDAFSGQLSTIKARKQVIGGDWILDLMTFQYNVAQLQRRMDQQVA